MGLLFKKGKQPTPIIPTTSSSGADTNRLAPNLEPIGSGMINVIDDFPWTLTPKTGWSRKETPYIHLVEYYQLDTQLNQLLKPYGFSPATAGFLQGAAAIATTNLGVIEPNTEQLYEGMFDWLEETKFVYLFPCFSPIMFDINTMWQGKDILDKIIQLQTLALEKTVGGAIKGSLNLNVAGLPRMLKDFEIFSIKSNNPTVGLIDPPHIWKNSKPREYTFQFPLFNTGFTDSVETQITKNWELCYLLTYQNLVNKRNFYTGIPPVYYSVEIPGVHFCKAAYMSNINITNIGNQRCMALPIREGGGYCDVNVPDAYLITIQMKDFFMPSKNFLRSAVNVTVRSQTTRRPPPPDVI